MSAVQRQQTAAQLKAVSSKLGLFVVIPQDDELVLDIDAGMQVNERVYQVLVDDSYLFDHHGLERLHTVSKSNNLHVYLKLRCEFGPGERIAMQAALGSDPMKEMLSALTLQSSKVPIAMFETDASVRLITAWRETFRKYRGY